jgi:hypothetical protein
VVGLNEVESDGGVAAEADAHRIVIDTSAPANARII